MELGGGKSHLSLHERLRVGDVVELQLLEMDDKIDKMDK